MKITRRLLMPAAGILCCATLLAQDAAHFSPGTVVPKVVCAGNPQQSYALYLPSSYSSAKRWPIIYVFDPGGRGPIAVEAIRAAAEKYGYIVVASNNSRNGAEAISTEAANSMWHDTAPRFSIDEHRRYFAGMSGGARMATALAISCKGCVAGVVANAAGFPQGQKPSRALKFAYFAGLGNADFNFLEFVELRRELEESAMHYRVRVFEGWHGWAPPEVWQEALHWMELQAVRSGVLNHDSTWVQESYHEATERASRLLGKGDILEAFREYGFAVRDFSGLADISSAQKELAALTNSKQLKKAQKQELSAADQQRRLMSEPSAEIQGLANGNLSKDELMVLRSAFTSLLQQARGFQAHGSSAGADRATCPERARNPSVRVRAVCHGSKAI